MATARTFANMLKEDPGRIARTEYDTIETNNMVQPVWGLMMKKTKRKKKKPVKDLDIMELIATLTRK